jgi:hypothetical protein
MPSNDLLEIAFTFVCASVAQKLLLVVENAENGAVVDDGKVTE